MHGICKNNLKGQEQSIHTNDETTNITCFLSSILDTLMCFAPLFSHAHSRVVLKV
jgi:hypothetical protein